MSTKWRAGRDSNP